MAVDSSQRRKRKRAKPMREQYGWLSAHAAAKTVGIPPSTWYVHHEAFEAEYSLRWRTIGTQRQYRLDDIRAMAVRLGVRVVNGK
jgi:hypothetical protein